MAQFYTIICIVITFVFLTINMYRNMYVSNSNKLVSDSDQNYDFGFVFFFQPICWQFLKSDFYTSSY